MVCCVVTLTSKNIKMEEPKVARPYQVELLNKAIKQNSIVYLGTGAGKTFIATMLIKEFQGDVIEKGKKTLFLVHRVPLLKQQAEFLAKNTSLRVKSFCGADETDFWKEDEWRDTIENNDILVMIHDVLLLALSHKYFSLKDVNLIVVDECHHSMGNSSFNQIFTGHYHQLKDDPSYDGDLPHVLGLSASIVTSKVSIDKFRRKMLELEGILDSKVITTKDLGNLLLHATQPDEIVEGYESPPSLPDLEAIVNDGIAILEAMKEAEHERINRIPDLAKQTREPKKDDVSSLLKSFKRILKQTEKALKDLGMLFGSQLLEESVKFVDEEILIRAQNPLKAEMAKVTKDTIASMEEWVNQEVDLYTNLVTDDWVLFRTFATKKVEKLLEILDYFTLGGDRREDKKAMTALVFVQERQIATALAALLNRVSGIKPSLSHIKAGYAVGGAFGKVFKEPGSSVYQKIALEMAQEEKRKLEQTIDDFKKKKINVIVSTSVLEEGMDISRCNLVVRFDPIPEFRSYVQSKGRARAKPSKFVIMVPHCDMAKWTVTYRQYQDIERLEIDSIHHEKTTGSDDGNENDEEFDEPYYANPEDKLNSARITGFQAISIVNRYVQTLPTDRFTKLVPYYEFVELEPEMVNANNVAGYGNWQCNLYLPHLTPYREPIIGDRKIDRKNAKRNVALTACKRLHEDGFLNDHLLPRKRVLPMLEEEITESSGPGPKDGTKKKKRYYPLEMPKALTNKGNGQFVYKINLSLVQVSKHAEVKKQYQTYHPEKFERKLAILTGDAIADEALVPFNVFTTSGTVEVRLELLKNESFQIAQDLNRPSVMQLVKSFQVSALKDVIGFADLIIKADGDKKEDLLLFPLNNKNKIDTDFLKHWNVEEQKQKSKKRRTSFVFEAEKYEDSVVIPLHRKMESFFVEEVVRDRSPKSPLPDHQTSTFAEHYATKFGCRITDMTQPLLRISNASKKHFMYVPINEDNSDKVETLDRNKFLNQKTLLIPELVAIHPIPGSLWREIQMIPFVLNRVRSLIKVNDIVQCLKREAELTFSLARKIDIHESSNSQVDFNHLINPLSKIASGPSNFDILEALTLKGAGEGFDMERLEILGDGFLKYSVSLALFCNKSIRRGDEGFLTQYRSILVGNKRLFRLAASKNLAEAVSAFKFEPAYNWMPPRFSQINQLEDKLCSWDEEFRCNFENESLDDDFEVDVTVNNNKKRAKVSKVTLFQLMTEDDLKTIQDQDKKKFLAPMRRRLQADAIPEGNKVRPRMNVLISDKSVADVVEALIGVHLAKDGQVAAIKFMNWIGLSLDPVASINKIISGSTNSSQAMDTAWFEQKTHLPKNGFCEVLDPEFESIMEDKFQRERGLNHLLGKINVKAVEDQLGYEFQDKSFLAQALTHASYSSNVVTDSYERLEFLGDAVIDFLVTCHLYTMPNATHLSPGLITDLRSALVNNNTLASVAVDNGLHKFLLEQNPDLFRKINAYVDEHELHLEEEGVAAEAGQGDVLLSNLELFNEEECPVLQDVEVPKVLGDLVESLIGAICLDSGCDLQECWRVLKTMFGSKMDTIVQRKPKNFVKQILELFPEKVTFKHAVLEKDGKVSMIVLIQNEANWKKPFQFKGIGNNKKLAKLAAAKCAVKELKKKSKMQLK